MILYGISNCDTVRKARKFLENQQVDFQFHDFRKDGLDVATIQNWLKTIDFSELLNKRSTTWKNLSESDRQAIENQDLTLLAQNPTLIKRPVLVTENTLLVGFNLERYQEVL
jgi:Spx/MgsR family transcriptional regulator